MCEDCPHHKSEHFPIIRLKSDTKGESESVHWPIKLLSRLTFISVLTIGINQVVTRKATDFHTVLTLMKITVYIMIGMSTLGGL